MKFRCKKCDETFEMKNVSKVKLKYSKKDDHLISYDENGIPISCPLCEGTDIGDGNEFAGFGQFCGFDSKTPEQKREILKKREVQHRKRDRIFNEYKKYKDNGGKE
jgi:hypothetical protein